MLDCTTTDYDRLYAPWLADPLALPTLAGWRRDEPLLDLCGGTGVVSRALIGSQSMYQERHRAFFQRMRPPPGGSNWCCSEGHTTHHEAQQHGNERFGHSTFSIPHLEPMPGTPHVVLFDQNPRAAWHDLFSPDARLMGRFRQVKGDANEVDNYFRPESFGVVVCRQAMGYLNPAKVIPAVAKLLRPGGRFVFNTFDPPTRARVKTYLYEGARYAEGHLFLFDRIVHLQMRLGPHAGADLSVFRCWYRDYICNLLMAHQFETRIDTEGHSVRWVATKGFSPRRRKTDGR